MAERKKAVENSVTQKTFPLGWKKDSVNYTMIPFKGYESGFKKSEATNLPVLFYDKNRPYSKQVKYFDTYLPEKIVSKPKAYIIPQGWWAVIDLLKLNGVKMERLKKDSGIEVNSYHINSLKSLPTAYEKHHKNYAVDVSAKKEKLLFLKGDYLVYLNQTANRYIIEMLEPVGDDSFFSWNFFDAILQQKEYFDAIAGMSLQKIS